MHACTAITAHHRAGGQVDGVLAAREGRLEPDHEAVERVVARGDQAELGLEVEIRRVHFHQIQPLQSTLRDERKASKRGGTHHKLRAGGHQLPLVADFGARANPAIAAASSALVSTEAQAASELTVGR